MRNIRSFGILPSYTYFYYKMIFRLKLFCLIILSSFFIPQKSHAQYANLKDTIVEIARLAKGTVGIAVMDLNSKDTISLNGSQRFPMQSVFKFPLALAILHLVDERKLSLTQIVHLTKEDYQYPMLVH